MTLEELREEWAVDSRFDQLAIENEISRIPKMHEKYLRYLTNANAELHQAEKTLDRLTYLKTMYYLGKMDVEVIKKYGWEPRQEIFLRSDIPMILAGDKEYAALLLNKKTIENKVTFCQSVLKELNNRNFQIRSFIDWKKYSAGY